MTIDTLTQQSRAHTGLAAIDTARLKAMRNASLRECFSRLDETRYRMEFVARIQGREYINDAAARSVNSAWYAMESIDGGIIWIACGGDAEADYGNLRPVAMRKVRMVLTLGSAERIRQQLGDAVSNIVECHSMYEALQKAYYYDAPDNVRVLFSPATECGGDTEYLGETFRKEVNEL